MKSYSRPLSSDAFSGFQSENATEHNKEVIEAHAKLREQIIPRFAECVAHTHTHETVFCGMHPCSSYAHYYTTHKNAYTPTHSHTYTPPSSYLNHTYLDLPDDSVIPLLEDLHARGINIRMLGLVRQHVVAPRVRALILTEVFARSASKLLQAKMRKASGSTVTDLGLSVLRLSLF